MTAPKLMFLHGINAAREERWLDPLNAAISWFGYEPFAPEDVLTPDYRNALRGSLVNPPASRRTWMRPEADEARVALTEYLARAANLEARLRPLANGQFPPFAAPSLQTVPPGPDLIKDASRYANEREIRAAVHHVVLREVARLPHGSSLVILAHSLGSVVATDILKKLPANLKVHALVTIGSPLASIQIFGLNSDLEDFPYDRVGAWVNIFEPRDLVTAARGIAQIFPEAIDIPIALHHGAVPLLTGQHGADYYCTHPAVAAAITGALYGTAIQTTGAAASRRVDGLEMLLLQSVYLRELPKQLPTKERERVARFERARRATAASHSAASAMLHERQPTTAFLQPEEFLDNPDELIRGVWDDRSLLALAIMLASAPPAPPFQVEEDQSAESRRKALLATVNLVRATRGSPSDVDIVDAIYDSKAEVDEYMGDGRSWLPIALASAGVLTLAATGLGLALAAPAGLAGAALITSTLASFGPGGMIGGMATLAALAATGSAMTATAVTLGATGPTQRSVDLLGHALDGAIASHDPEAVRSLLSALLTMVGAQERLQWPTQRDAVLFACLSAHARATRLVFDHDLIDPKSRAAKASRLIRDLLEKSCSWLRGAEKPSTPDAREMAGNTSAFLRALIGDPAALSAALQRPVRSGPEQLSISQ